MVMVKERSFWLSLMDTRSFFTSFSDPVVLTTKGQLFQAAPRHHHFTWRSYPGSYQHRTVSEPCSTPLTALGPEMADEPGNTNPCTCHLPPWGQGHSLLHCE